MYTCTGLKGLTQIEHELPPDDCFIESPCEYLYWLPSHCLTRIFDLTYHKTYEVIIWHDDVIKWRHIPRCWPFTRGIHRSPVNSPHRGQWRGVLMFSLISTRVNGWVNNREAGDFRRHYAHYDVIVMDSQEVLVDLAMVKNGWLLQMTFSKVYYYENYFWLTILTYVVAVWVRIIICHPCFG